MYALEDSKRNFQNVKELDGTLSDERSYHFLQSFRNLPQVHVLPADQLNTYDVLVSDFVVFATHTLPGASAPAEAEEGTD